MDITCLGPNGWKNRHEETVFDEGGSDTYAQ